VIEKRLPTSTLTSCAHFSEHSYEGADFSFSVTLLGPCDVIEGCKSPLPPAFPSHLPFTASSLQTQFEQKLNPLGTHSQLASDKNLSGSKKEKTKLYLKEMIRGCMEM
jgi:hypothetical protein